MNGKDFLNELEHLDDDLVQKHEMPKKRKPAWRKYVGIAACAALVCAGLFGLTVLSGGWGGGSSTELATSGEASGGSSQEASGEITLLAAAKEAEVPQRPDESVWEKEDASSEEIAAYWDDMERYLEEKEEIEPDSAYLTQLSGFASSTIRQILTNEEQKDRNIVYSPANLYMALTMLTECAEGNTRQQLLDLLGTEDTQIIQEQTDLIWKSLYKDDDTGIIKLANSIWLNEKIPFHQDTIDLLADKYYASSYHATMPSQKTNKAIAEWINENTGGLLKEQTQAVETKEDTAAILYSTLYFYSSWHEPFEKENTKEDVFTCSDGTEQTVDFMHMTENGDFIRGDGYNMAWRFFRNGKTMYFVLPDERTSVDELLSNDALMQQIMEADSIELNCSNGKVVWSMPKFDIASTEKLVDCLKSLGVTDAFNYQNANFAPLSDNSLYVSEVTQSARVRVDEEGCEAAAYTEVTMGAGAEIEQPEICEMNLNRPFLFVITGEDNLPLFVGVVNQVGE
ncbi:MAG: serpin family protein [Butyricicoccus sp.]